MMQKNIHDVDDLVPPNDMLFDGSTTQEEFKMEAILLLST